MGSAQSGSLSTKAITSYFPVQPKRKKKVHLNRRLRTTARTTPLAGPSGASNVSSAEYNPRLHRPEVVPTAPHRLPRQPGFHRYTNGERWERTRPLRAEDLYTSDRKSPPLMDALNAEHECCVCRQLKSHPVSYVARLCYGRQFMCTFRRFDCGHGACYTCIRVCLEIKWECPECRAVMTREPIRVWSEEKTIRGIYGEWDDTTVDYSWDGLRWPTLE